MTDEQTKQAITGFAEFFKAITGNQNLEIPKDMAEKCGIQAQADGEYVSRQEVHKLIGKRWVNSHGMVSEVLELLDEDICKLQGVSIPPQAQEDGEYITQSAGDEIRQKNYDLISRQAVLSIVDSYSESQRNVEDVTQDIISDIVVLPSVKPKEERSE